MAPSWHCLQTASRFSGSVNFCQLPLCGSLWFTTASVGRDLPGVSGTLQRWQVNRSRARVAGLSAARHILDLYHFRYSAALLDLGLSPMRTFTLALAALASTASAHDYNDVSVDTLSRITGFWQINVADTVSGYRIKCVVYDEGGTVIGQASTRTDDLATAVYVSDRGGDAHSVRCVMLP